MTLKGCYVACVTPFTSNGQVSEPALRSHINFLISHGVAGIVPCGTTGESATLSWEEHNRIVDITIEECRGKVAVVAGAGSNNTAESIHAALHAQEKGADAILCITPYYNKPTQEGLFQHYRGIAKKVDIPIVVYNVPGRTGVNLQPDTLERLCAFPTIVAVKEASGNIGQVSEIHRRCGDRLTILSGDDGLTLPMLSVGASGVISVVANIVPQRMVALLEGFFACNLSEALRLHEVLLPLCDAMFFETNPIPVKTAMNLIGMNAGTLRLPLVDMAKHNKERLVAVLKSYDFVIRE
ncbi:MAG: 4-hydroxy-tetrahydrodipicolinate synthase [Chitinispirillaceae bacterium]|nr:4-hydroxy-tetrahydrodipicolinate synthase [Chitinispirillaceae bacterium]